MLKFGIVSKLDSGTCRVKVRFDADDNLESTWLPVLQKRTFNDKFYGMPDTGEHVVCLMDGDDGVVLGAIYSSVDTVPEGATEKTEITEYSDGTRASYDEAQHKLEVSVAGGISVESQGNTDVKASNVTIDCANDAVVKAQKVSIGNEVVELLDQIVKLLDALMNSIVPTVAGPQKLSETFLNFPIIKAKMELLKK